MEKEKKNLGIGVMIQMLGGNAASVEAVKGAIGKTISHVELKDDALYFTFNDESRIKISDEGQSCCEHRYMGTDDDLEYYVGAQLLGFEIKEAPTIKGEYGDEHEVQFLEVKTSKGVFTMASHNEHNGYYGGFAIRVAEEQGGT